jgi:hypothetical protein
MTAFSRSRTDTDVSLVQLTLRSAVFIKLKLPVFRNSDAGSSNCFSYICFSVWIILKTFVFLLTLNCATSVVLMIYFSEVLSRMSSLSLS